MKIISIGKYIAVASILIFGLSACTKDFLGKPQGNDVNVDSIFSTSQKSQAAIAMAYAESLSVGITLSGWDGNRDYGLCSSTLSHISGELNDLKYNWEDGWMIQRSGMKADDGSGKQISDDSFVFNFKCLRQNYLVMENIDKVKDMSKSEKDQVKAEMKTLTAYRYEEMFKRYGGVPIVTKSLSATDSIKIPRASLQQTLDFIVKLCDEAAQVLPNSYPDNWKGRVTKGVALAIKAEALMFAARPLFNSATPYLDLGANNKLICFGNVDQNRWQKAADACKAVLDWANSTKFYHVINTGSPLDDYGTAVSTPNNPEVLLAYKYQGNLGNYDQRTEGGGANGMSFYQISQYVKADGTEQTWATTESPYSEYAAKMQQMEPRYKASAAAAGMDAWNNPNDVNWNSQTMSGRSTWEGRGGTEACGRRVKFWYHAGTRNWFEFPIYRLAEFYLDCAEAYNELGQPSVALPYLNVIRDRAGLPEITETNQVNLRKMIQREWAVEFYEEGHRFFDVKHWKLPDIGNGIIGGDKKSFVFTYVNGSYGLVASDYKTYVTKVVYTGYWSPNQYLSPIPIKEINKGYLVQNPRY
ncbi:MAG: RagB/SusD family nutrient uptake outer membrane protein [Bacteroidota bacterium]|nr:RagB/SusD family nutrient uptake outer membrane protein [Bacteroidota bacterium]